MGPKSFHIGDLLSISTGNLVSRDHIGGVYNILNHMTGDNLFTHQLPAAAEVCLPHLLAAHPWLNGITPPVWPEGREQASAAVNAWVEEQAAAHGAWHEVPKLNASVWGQHDPLADLQAMVGDKPIIVVATE